MRISPDYVIKAKSLSSQGDPWHYCVDNCRILGLCTGALAAAVVSCSGSILELIPMAIDAVTVAFRTGMLVTDVAQRIEPSDGSDPSWSTIVSGVNSAKATARLCEQVRSNHLILHSPPFLCTSTNLVSSIRYRP